MAQKKIKITINLKDGKDKPDKFTNKNLDDKFTHLDEGDYLVVDIRQKKKNLFIIYTEQIDSVEFS